tara:strand:+ start:238 stop:381 length:144 start_codon:yes stop_codon:yes gene_type:complete
VQSLSGQTEPLPVFYKKGIFGAITRSGQAISLQWIGHVGGIALRKGA